jgi:hypothetical protein
MHGSHKVRMVGLVGAVLAVVTLAFVWHTTRSRADTGHVPASAKADLCSIALTMAATNGDPKPSRIDATSSTRQAAVEVIEGKGEDVMSDEPVYVVQMTGDFVGYEAKTPDNQDPPTGKGLAFTVGIDNGNVLDWGIADAPADISTLGTVSDPCSSTTS